MFAGFCVVFVVHSVARLLVNAEAPWSTDSSCFCAPSGEYVRAKIDANQRTVPYGQKFLKSAYDRRIFHVISADSDADRHKKRQF